MVFTLSWTASVTSWRSGIPRSAASDFARRKRTSGISSVVFICPYYHIYGNMGVREVLATCWQRIPPASLCSRVGMTGADVRSGIRNPHPNVAKGGDVRMGYPVFFSFSVLFLWADLQLFRGEYAGCGQSCRGESLIGREHEPGAAAVAYAAAVGAELIKAVIARTFDGIAEGDGDVSVFVAGDRRDVDGRRESSDRFSREVALLHAHGRGTEVGADEEVSAVGGHVGDCAAATSERQIDCLHQSDCGGVEGGSDDVSLLINAERDAGPAAGGGVDDVKGARDGAGRGVHGGIAFDYSAGVAEWSDAAGVVASFGFLRSAADDPGDVLVSTEEVVTGVKAGVGRRGWGLCAERGGGE